MFLLSLHHLYEGSGGALVCLHLLCLFVSPLGPSTGYARHLPFTALSFRGLIPV